ARVCLPSLRLTAFHQPARVFLGEDGNAAAVRCSDRYYHLPPLAFEMVADKGHGRVVAGLAVGLVAGDEDGEVFPGSKPGDCEPHGVAAGMGKGGTAGPGVAVGGNPAPCA